MSGGWGGMGGRGWRLLGVELDNPYDTVQGKRDQAASV